MATNRSQELSTPRDESAAEKADNSRELSTAVWTIPNILTVFRILLTVPFLYLVHEGRFGYALLVFFSASLTDFIDGYIARTFKQHSQLGRFLDPLADKVLTTAAFVVMAIPHSGFPSIPVWMAVAVVGRDLIIVLGALAVYLFTTFRDFKPTLLGKINTLFELGLIVWFLVFHTTGKLIFLLPYLYALVAASIVLSGLEYLIKGVTVIASDRRASPSDTDTKSD